MRLAANLFLILCISITCVSSCVQDVILDAGEESKVVVECILNDSDVQELHLNFTKGASRTEAEPLNEAVATLIDLTEGKTVGQFVKSESDLWTLDYQAIPLHHYRLEVLVPGYELIYGEDIMPEECIVQAFTKTEDIYLPGPMPIRHPELGSSTSAYFAGTFYSVYGIPEITLIYGMNYNSRTGKHELAEDIFTTLPVADKFNITDKIYVPELEQWENQTYDAVKSLYIDLKGTYKHKQYLRLEAQNIESHIDNSESDYCDFLVFGSFTGNWYWYSHAGIDYRLPSPDEGYLVFESLSENYDQYIRNAIQFKHIKESTDMSGIYLRDNIYTNITGGLGIFAASSRLILPCANKFRTGILEDRFKQYGIINVDGDYCFEDSLRQDSRFHITQN